MNKELLDKLNEIPKRITSKDFLENKGLGNDIGFYIFDYPAEEELEVRRFVADMITNLSKKDINIACVNLFEEILGYLTDRNFKEKAFEMQKVKGDEALLKALSGPLNPTRFTDYLAEKVGTPDVIILTGIGSAWPILRAHEILNNLQSKVGQVPLVLFYPGEYDKMSLKLFGRVKSNNYYRAFKLVV